MGLLKLITHFCTINIIYDSGRQTHLSLFKWVPNKTHLDVSHSWIGTVVVFNQWNPFNNEIHHKCHIWAISNLYLAITGYVAFWSRYRNMGRNHYTCTYLLTVTKVTTVFTHNFCKYTKGMGKICNNLYAFYL